MATVKTAISLEEDLLGQVGDLAISMNLSRSRVFALAVEDFLKRERNKEITRQLNEAYTDAAAEEDQEILRRMRPIHRRLVEAEW